MITLKIKDMFFDKAVIIRAMDAKKHRALFRFAGSVRLTARRSMRKRKKISAPGSPPSAHGLPLLREKILFGYDRKNDSVVVGPVSLPKWAGGKLPGLMEHGGSITVTERRLAGGSWTLGRLTRGRRAGRAIQTRRRTLTYKARPYMMPALEKMLPRLPREWSGSIRR